MSIHRRLYLALRAPGTSLSALDLVALLGEGTAASVTARVRELRQDRHGAHNLVCRRDGAGVYRYSIEPRALSGADWNRLENGATAGG